MSRRVIPEMKWREDLPIPFRTEGLTPPGTKGGRKMTRKEKALIVLYKEWKKWAKTQRRLNRDGEARAYETCADDLKKALEMK